MSVSSTFRTPTPSAEAASRGPAFPARVAVRLVVCSLGLVVGSVMLAQDDRSIADARKRASVYLSVEVPRWKVENSCYSCHNNGDAARALMANGQEEALRDTLEWLRHPERWDAQQKDAPFRDKNLARIQFSFALAEARKRGLIEDRKAVREAARLLAGLQAADGSWPVEDEANVGSPATYGTPLATFVASWVVSESGEPALIQVRERAGQWLARSQSAATIDVAARLLSAQMIGDEKAGAELRARLIAAQNPDGGWGPYRASPSEVFDTAVAMLALHKEPARNAEKRGTAFLLKSQLPNGGWPATTRPSGVASYAQHVSTTGWALLALSNDSPR